MCGRFTLFLPPDELGERFDVAVPEGWTPSYNVAPGEEIPTIDPAAGCQLRRWGLVPEWADDPDEDGHVNARAESVEERSSFRTAVRRRRCLVPADGFYEWTGEADSRRPHRIAFDDGRTFAMAGVWERWEGRRAQTDLEAFAGGGAADAADEPPAIERETVAVLTTAAAEPVASLHDRMPVILPADGEREWLDADDPTDRARLLSSPDVDGLQTHPVSTAVNDPRRDSPDLIEPVEG